MEFTPISVKINLNDELRRVTLDTPTLSQLVLLLNRVVAGNYSYSFTYHDSESDVISISSDMELLEAIRQARFGQPAVLRLDAKIIGEELKEQPRLLVELPEERKEHEPVAEEEEEEENNFSGLIFHEGVICNACNFPVVGIRFKCLICPNFDLCELCEAIVSHPIDHPLLKARTPLPPQFERFPALDSVTSSVQEIQANLNEKLHNCKAHLTRTYKEWEPHVVAARQQALDSWSSATEQIKQQWKTLSEQMKEKAKELNQELQDRLQVLKQEPAASTTTVEAESSATVMPEKTVSSSIAAELTPPPIPERRTSTIHYPEALEQLTNMGFSNRDVLIALLETHRGDVEAVIQHLVA